jgi:hypothetical protein
MASWVADPADTVTESRSEPEDEIEPSLTDTVADSALYNAITPLLPDDTVATPFVKVIVVAVPKLTALPVLLVTVGALPLSDDEAPVKVIDLSPV